ncbi:MAG: Gfo/Idh/MocA family oxidoreductase [Candidatus Ancillula sp.]|jgi:predicted dehydrogenase|nr:Gfo/Idh/MocA family oxidoreductase [Candidatus Ancillula sp.]
MLDKRNFVNCRWGILGTGGIAATFAREVMAEGGQVVAVASRTFEKAQKFQEIWGSGRYGVQNGQSAGGPAYAGGSKIAKVYGSYEELIADPDVDVIYVASPHSEHYKHAKMCLEGGKPVLVEKAFTRNQKEAREVFELAKSKNLFCMEAVWTRFLPHIKAVKKIIDRGDIGEILQVTGAFGIKKEYDPKHRLFNPDLAGGCLLDLGIYPLQLIHMILGSPQDIQKQVHAFGGLTPDRVDGNLSVGIEYNNPSSPDQLRGNISNKTVASFTSTTLGFTKTVASIVGTEGRIDIFAPFYRPANFEVTIYNQENGETEHSGFPTYTYNGKIEYDQLFGQDAKWGMHFEAIEVANCLATGKIQSEIMSWQDTLELQAIMDEIRSQVGVKFPGE